MNKTIVAKVNMFDNVDEVLEENETIVDTSPPFRVMADNFHTELVDIHAKMEFLSLNPKGYAKRKTETKKVLSLQLSVVCGAMKAYASDSNDPTLYQKADLSFSKLNKMRGTELVELSKALHTLATSIQVHLISYNVGAQTLSKLKTEIDNFELYNKDPRQVKVERKTIRAELYKKVKALNLFLKDNMDNATLAFKLTNPSFYNLYRNARRNYSLGVRHRQPEAEGLESIETKMTVQQLLPNNDESLSPDDAAERFDNALEDMKEQVGETVQ